MHLKGNISDQRQLRAFNKRIKSIFNSSTIAIEFNYSGVFPVCLPADAAMSVDLVASETGFDAVQERLAIDRRLRQP